MTTTFDEYAESYEEACHRGLALTGEGRDFYARSRCRITGAMVSRHGTSVERILDFGCGLGHTTPLLATQFPGAKVVGYDPATQTVELATRQYGSENIQFMSDWDGAAADFDLVYTNGVFHHIPPSERPAAIARLHALLRPGGLLAVWENNPWNPGTRWVMSRIPFDRDAILVSAPRMRGLALAADFQIVRTQFHFYFPAALIYLRRLEAALTAVPLGGQYCVMAVKPR